MERRGLHTGIWAWHKWSMESLERLVGKIAPSLGFNWVVLEINGRFAFKSHPEVRDPEPMTAEQARSLARLARANGVTLVPMYNCLGHQSGIEHKSAMLRGHPEFNEAPEMDASAPDFYCPSWCPNHPEVNPLLFDLFDEMIDGFEAEAFHVGMDEVFVIGECPRCKGTPNWELFAKAVNDYHGHLVGKRGVEMQMWGDRLLEAKAMGRGKWDASANETHQAVDVIPKDIVMCDWHYDNWDDFPSVAFFVEKGFRVWPAGWNEVEAVRHFIEVAREQGSPKVLGYMATTWTDVNDVVAGLAGEPTDPKNKGIEKIVAAVRAGAELSRD